MDGILNLCNVVVAYMNSTSWPEWSIQRAGRLAGQHTAGAGPLRDETAVPDRSWWAGAEMCGDAQWPPVSLLDMRCILGAEELLIVTHLGGRVQTRHGVGGEGSGESKKAEKWKTPHAWNWDSRVDIGVD